MLCKEIDLTVTTLNLSDPAHERYHLAAARYYLAEALYHRSLHTLDKNSEDKQIDLCRQALLDLGDDAPSESRAAVLARLGMSHRVRNSEVNDLDAAKAHLTDAVELCPTNPEYLSHLGAVMHNLFYKHEQTADLERAIQLNQQSYELRTGHPAQDVIISHLTAALSEGYMTGIRDSSVLDQLLRLYAEILPYVPEGHRDHWDYWAGIGVLYQQLYRKKGDPAYLDLSVVAKENACRLIHPNHKYRYMYQNNLSVSLQSRFQLLGKESDVRAAIMHAREALTLCPGMHVGRHAAISTLTGAMMLVEERSANEDSLAEIISLRREAVDICGGHYRDYHLNGLGEALLLRFLRAGERGDLFEAISLQREALALRGREHPARQDVVKELGQALLQHYRLMRDSAYLDEAIELYQELEQANPSDSWRSIYLMSIGDANRLRYLHHGRQEDLQKAMECHQAALELRPPGHIQRYASLSAIAEDLSSQYLVTHNFCDVERALYLQQQVLSLLPIGHVDRALGLVNLAKQLLLPGCPDAILNEQKALHHLLEAILDPYRDLQRRMGEVLDVLRDIEETSVPSWSPSDPRRTTILEIYRVMIDLLPQVASFGLHLRTRVHVLERGRDLAVRAAAHAVYLSQPKLAIEALAAGRAVFWAQYLRLRASFDGLPPDMARRLTELCYLLEAGSMDRPAPLHAEDNNTARGRAERELAERRRLAEEFERLLEQARALPNRRSFLRSLDYDSIAQNTRGRGPHAILLASSRASWALLVTAPDTEPEVVSLPGVTEKWLYTASTSFRTCVQQSRDAAGKRGMKMIRAQDPERISEETLLKELFLKVTRPIITRLGWKVRSSCVVYIRSANMGADKAWLCQTAPLYMSDRSF
jgi:tetratricopeptide (TPR) repeat protein